MSENSSIEWTDHTFNPWIGCTKVSPGCANCYAETQDKFRSWTPEGWGKGKPRKRTSEANWMQPLKWNRQAVKGVLREDWHRPRVFCASLADWLDDEVPAEWLSDLIYLICKCNHLDWQLLTKRPQLWRSRLEAVSNGSDLGAIICRQWLDGNPPPNVWIGTTVEDQQRADERIPALLEIPAKVRFLSCEPLLGPVEFSNVTKRADAVSQLGKKALSGIHWVIAGGESGPKARPIHPDWARSLRDQCQSAGVPFLFKQWGEHAPNWFNDEAGHPIPGSEWMDRVGKKAAGRQLDGREWNEFPKGGEA